MADTEASKLLTATQRHQDIQKSIREHAAQLGKTTGPQRQEEANPNGGTDSGH